MSVSVPRCTGHRGLAARCELVLVRHGESTWNAESRLQGQADPPLSDRGRAQVARLAPAIRELAPQSVVTSDLIRVRETAELLGLGWAAADPRWRELDLGDWTGRRIEEVRAESNGAYTAWREGRDMPPGGEPWSALGDRVFEAVEALQGARRSLVVTHGGVIRVLTARVLGIEINALAGVGNASVTVLELGERARLVAYDRRA